MMSAVLTLKRCLTLFADWMAALLGLQRLEPLVQGRPQGPWPGGVAQTVHQATLLQLTQILITLMLTLTVMVILLQASVMKTKVWNQAPCINCLPITL